MIANMNSRLVLGTAQLGMPYGIANSEGQPDQTQADRIVMSAWQGGISNFDTAQTYGKSEIVLGKVLKKNLLCKDAKVVTKFDPQLDYFNEKAMMFSVDESLRRLGVDSLYGIMFHDEEIVDVWGGQLSKMVEELRVSGKVQHVGVSFYSPERALKALQIREISMIQIPVNILDRRFIDSGVYANAIKDGMKVYVRSAFLQGLLLMNAVDLPARMNFATGVVEQVGTCAADMGLQRIELALLYLKHRMPDARVLFGAESSKQVEENLSCWEDRKNIAELASRVEEVFADVDERIIRPDRWPK